MEIVLIVLIIFGISLALSIYQLVRQGPSLRAGLSVVLSAVFFIGVFFIYLDVTDFRNNFEDSDKLFLLQDESHQFIAGFSGKLKGSSIPIFLNAGELVKKQAQYEAKDTEAFVGSHYKVFVIQPVIFEPITQVINYGNITLTPLEAQGIIQSGQPASDFANLYLAKLGLDTDESGLKSQLMTDLRIQAEDDSSMRGLVFAQLISAGFDTKGPNFLISAIANNHVKVFKETALFMLIHYTPPFLLEQVTQFEETDELTG